MCTVYFTSGGLLPVSVNKVLLAFTLVYVSSTFTTRAELNYDRDGVMFKAENIYSLRLYRKRFCQPLMNT